MAFTESLLLLFPEKEGARNTFFVFLMGHLSPEKRALFSL
jgi:hypothetical protein